MIAQYFAKFFVMIQLFVDHPVLGKCIYCSTGFIQNVIAGSDPVLMFPGKFFVQFFKLPVSRDLIRNQDLKFIRATGLVQESPLLTERFYFPGTYFFLASSIKALRVTAFWSLGSLSTTLASLAAKDFTSL